MSTAKRVPLLAAALGIVGAAALALALRHQGTGGAADDGGMTVTDTGSVVIDFGGVRPAEPEGVDAAGARPLPVTGPDSRAADGVGPAPVLPNVAQDASGFAMRVDRVWADGAMLVVDAVVEVPYVRPFHTTTILVDRPTNRPIQPAQVVRWEDGAEPVRAGPNRVRMMWPNPELARRGVDGYLVLEIHQRIDGYGALPRIAHLQVPVVYRP